MNRAVVGFWAMTYASVIALGVAGAAPLADPLPAVPTVTLPAAVQAQPGRLTLIRASTNGRVVKWVCLDDAVDLLPYLDNTAIFSTAAPGSYRVLAYTALGDVPSQPAVCTVTVVGPFPPQPPVPPNPPIPPAPPADPLYGALLPAWQAEADPGKAAQKAALAGVYRQMVAVAGQAGIATIGDLFNALVAQRKAVVADTALVQLRTAIGGQTSVLLPTAPTAPLDAATRATAANVFTRIAQVLEVLP